MTIPAQPSRRSALALGAGAAAALAAGGVAAQPRDEVRAAITGFSVINTLDPARASLLSEFYVIWGVFNGLVTFDEAMRVVPDLAESVVVRDPTTLEFRLRAGHRFHDGAPLTADDVVFSLERVLDPRTASPNRGKLLAVESVAAVDPLTVRLTTRAPFAPLLSYLTNTRTGTQIVPRAAVRAAGEEGFGRRPVGTGAYRVVAWSPNESVELAAAPATAARPKALIERVRVPLIAEESSGLTALLGGQVDLTSTAPFADVPALAGDPRARVLKQPGLNARYVALNLRRPPFDDVHLRRAVSMAFDRAVLVRAVVFGEGVVTPGLLPPALAGERGPLPDLVRFDPERARAELSRGRSARGVEAAVLVWGSAWWRRLGELIVAQVNATLGTRFRVEVGDTNAVFARLRAGEYEAAVWGWLGLTDFDEYLGEILGRGGFRNFSGYESEAFEALLAEGRRELDPDRRRAIYLRADRAMLEDMPILPCFASNVHHLVGPRLQGFVQRPYSNFGDQFAALSMR